MGWRDQFADRLDAARKLAASLEQYRGRLPLVLAIPRGAVPMAKVIADHLLGELDVVLVHKIAAPFDPECALGAIDENGRTYLQPYAQEYGGHSAWLREEKQRQIDALKGRRAQYTPYRPPIDPKGRVAIVVDDGIATGSTMIAALHAVRARTGRAGMRHAGCRARQPGKHQAAGGQGGVPARARQFRQRRPLLPRLPPGRGRGSDRHPR